MPPQHEGPIKKEQFAPSSHMKPYTTYGSSDEIRYTWGDAVVDGLAMVDVIDDNISKLKVGAWRRKTWGRDIQHLKSQAALTTVIAVCGATGSGKSSLLNAVLDDNIVPTSGLKACTSYVTEIRYHDKDTIDATVCFVSQEEWREELTSLLDELVDDNGSFRRSTDKNSSVAVALEKVYAVYPSVTQVELSGMTADQLISRSPEVKALLGTGQHISAANSKIFCEEIAKYIGFGGHVSGNQKSKTAYWPLIAQVKIFCCASSLSTGAVLVDLPGVADANAARDKIAKGYLERCDCIWIIASITRAVDEKVARDLRSNAFQNQIMMGLYNGVVFTEMIAHKDLNFHTDGLYNGSSITFIATKCDDIDTDEIIPELGLMDNPELNNIQNQLTSCKVVASELLKVEERAGSAIKENDEQQKQLEISLMEYKSHLTALENGQDFVPSVTDMQSGKRRRHNQGEQRRKKSRFGEDIYGYPESAHDEDTSDESYSTSDSEANHSSGEMTTDSLTIKILDVETALKDLLLGSNIKLRAQREAAQTYQSLQKQIHILEQKKKIFCSLKRSESSRSQLKEDFRTGLREFDDDSALMQDLEAYDPDVDQRDYNNINLPVFTCSSRDYSHLKGNNSNDQPACFLEIEDTGIPDLQKWCRKLPLSSQERITHSFLNHLNILASAVHSYAQGAIPGLILQDDREKFRKRWQSITGNPPLNGQNNPRILPELQKWHIMNENTSVKVEQPVNDLKAEFGLGSCLMRGFKTILDDYIHRFSVRIAEDLGELCIAGAKKANSAAMKTSDAFANDGSVSWQAYSQMMVNLGCCPPSRQSPKRNLNSELLHPFLRHIAPTWAKVFKQDYFVAFEKVGRNTLTQVLAEVETSAPPGLKEYVKDRKEVCMHEATVVLQETLRFVRNTLNTGQRNGSPSRVLEIYVQDALEPGYKAASQETGRGSVVRKKAVFRDYLQAKKDHVFNDIVVNIRHQLMIIIRSVTEELEDNLTALAEKIEVNISELWEDHEHDDPARVAERAAVVATMSEIVMQVQFWQEAEQRASAAAAAAAADPSS